MPPDESILIALKQALVADPGNGPLWIHYAGLLHGAGRAEEAIAALRGAVERVADRRPLIKRMVPLLRETGQIHEAEVRAEMLLDVRDEPEVRVEYARILLARGSQEAAAREYRRAVECDRSAADP